MTGIEIELLPHAKPISGRVKTRNLDRDFTGWLELMSAIEDSHRHPTNTAPDQLTGVPCAQPADTDIDPIFDRVLSPLGDLPGVAAVALGGSRARDQGLPDSDVDIAVYYSRADPPAIEELHRIATDLHDPGAPKLLGGYGEWGPWINGGALITIAGRRTDLLLRELEQVETVIHNCHRGVVESVYTPGHPHAFHTHIYAGEAHHNQPLLRPLRRARRAQEPDRALPPTTQRNARAALRLGDVIQHPTRRQSDQTRRPRLCGRHRVPLHRLHGPSHLRRQRTLLPQRETIRRHSSSNDTSPTKLRHARPALPPRRLTRPNRRTNRPTRRRSRTHRARATRRWQLTLTCTPKQ